MSYYTFNIASDQPGNPSPWKAPMTTTPTHVTGPTVDVTEMNAAEWKAAVQRALDNLRLTYDQLADQAQRRDFSSLAARKLWVAIGGKRP